MRCAVLIEAMLPPMCGTDLAHAAVFTALAYAMFRDCSRTYTVLT